jgi:hypothetical protein
MKLYLDDVRPIPTGWVGVRTYEEAIHVIDNADIGSISEISLDHDLGTEKDGADVLQYLIDNNIVPDIVYLHTMNPLAKLEMQRMLERHRSRLEKFKIDQER